MGPTQSSIITTRRNAFITSTSRDSNRDKSGSNGKPVKTTASPNSKVLKMKPRP